MKTDYDTYSHIMLLLLVFNKEYRRLGSLCKDQAHWLIPDYGIMILMFD